MAVRKRIVLSIFVIAIMQLAVLYLWQKHAHKTQQCHLLAYSLNETLLMLRRHEKDFLARRIEAYTEKWKRSYTQLKTQIDVTMQCFSGENTRVTRLTTAAASLKQYQLGFYRLLSNMNEDDKDSAILMRKITRLQDEMEVEAKNDRPQLYAQLLSTRDHLFSYLVSQSPFSIAMLKKHIAALQQWSDQDKATLNQLAQYSVLAMQLEQRVKDSRNFYNQGELGNMRKHAHQMEKEFNALSASLSQTSPWSLFWLSIAIVLILLPSLVFAMLSGKHHNGIE